MTPDDNDDPFLVMPPIPTWLIYLLDSTHRGWAASLVLYRAAKKIAPARHQIKQHTDPVQPTISFIKNRIRCCGVLLVSTKSQAKTWFQKQSVSLVFHRRNSQSPGGGCAVERSSRAPCRTTTFLASRKRRLRHFEGRAVHSSGHYHVWIATAICRGRKMCRYFIFVAVVF